MKKTLICSFTLIAALSTVFVQAHAQDAQNITSGSQASSVDNTASGTVSPATTDANNAEVAKTTGEAFMAQNKTKPGVITLPSGLQYSVIEQGNGKKPGKNDTVVVDYEGKLLNGQVFDSSYQRGQPATFPLSAVIPGWQEALQLMNEGSTWMLYIPSSLAYGEAGAGGVIGPNEVLVFKVHLIKVQ